MRQRRAHKSLEQWMRLIGTALEFRVVLHAHMERTIGQFHRLNEPAVGRNAAESQALALEQVAVVVVELIAMMERRP